MIARASSLLAQGVVFVALAASPAASQPPIEKTFQADAGTLGPIPDGPGGAPCATIPAGRTVTFTVDESGPVVGVAVSLTFVPVHTSAGEVTVTLVDPQGRSLVLFGRPGATSLVCGSSADLAGPYTFSDAASGDFFQTAVTAAGSVVPAGSYRSVTAGSRGQPGVTTSLDATFVGRPARGVWRLVVSDGAAGNTGGIAAASLTLTVAPVTAADPATLGGLPVHTCTAGTPRTPSRDVTFDVSGAGGTVSSVIVGVNLDVFFTAYLEAELIAPDGVGRHLLFPPELLGRGGKHTNGYYEFSDSAQNDWGLAYGDTGPLTLPEGAYRTVDTALFPTRIDPAFAGRSPNGRWTLRITNCLLNATATVSAARLSLVTTVASTSDAFTVEGQGSLVVPAPGVLANDSGLGRLTATLISVPANGTVTLAGNGGFTYVPAAGFLGQDRFEYRPSSAGSTGQNTAVTIDVTPPRSRPASNVEVVNVTGNHAVLRWDPPTAGVVPTAYELTAGTTPGQVLARLPLPPNPPVFEVDAPPGVFFVRLTTQSAAGPSGPSNDARLSVGVADPPSPPVSLTGLANGDILTLHWKDTFAGGAPTGAVLDVSGAFTGSLPISGGGGFTFPGVPAGTYTFALRAANGAGVSIPSNPVTLTFPGACSGPPAAPTRLLAYARGAGVGVLWDPPPAGPAPERYDLHVSGSFTGTLPMGLTRTLNAPAPSGVYAFTITASNACGTSAPTATATVTVP